MWCNRMHFLLENKIVVFSLTFQMEAILSFSYDRRIITKIITNTNYDRLSLLVTISVLNRN